MTWIILKRMNSVFFVVLALLTIAVQSTVFHYPPLSYLQPDLLLLFVVWCGLERNYYEGGVLTLTFAYLAELHSSAPSGLFLLTYIIVYLTVRLSKRFILLSQRSALILFCMAMSVYWKIVLQSLLFSLNAQSNHWHHFFFFLAPGALVQGLVAWPVLWSLNRFDWITFKNPRAAAQLEDELKLEGEGF